jgi:hypothetical protein
MKRVVWIERQSKRSNGRVSAQGTVVMSEKIGSTVALRQALIPLGPHAVGETWGTELVAFL